MLKTSRHVSSDAQTQQAGCLHTSWQAPRGAACAPGRQRAERRWGSSCETRERSCSLPPQAIQWLWPARQCPRQPQQPARQRSAQPSQRKGLRLQPRVERGSSSGVSSGDGANVLPPPPLPPPLQGLVLPATRGVALSPSHRPPTLAAVRLPTPASHAAGSSQRGPLPAPSRQPPAATMGGRRQSKAAPPLGPQVGC